MANKRIIKVKDIDSCFKCRATVSYHDKFDCFYCMKCNIWLEPKCDDLFCSYCRKRPTRPINKKEDKKKKNKKKKRKIEW